MSQDMKLWLLRPVGGLPVGDNPWSPWYDKCFGFVVRAATGQRAREIAMSKAGDEINDTFLGKRVSNTRTPWLDPKYSTCMELLQSGDEGRIISDFASA